MTKNFAEQLEPTEFELDLIDKWPKPEGPGPAMDPECVRLCATLNALPGIRTTESCCGHGDSRYRIWLMIDPDSVGALVLQRALSGRYYRYGVGESRYEPTWRCFLGDSDVDLSWVLEGGVMPRRSSSYPPADCLAQNIAALLASTPDMTWFAKVAGKSELVENLADYAHDSWSGWMRYLFSKSKDQEDGTVVIPRELVERWSRQVVTRYAGLPESEKKSDRAEAAKMLEVIDKARSARSGFDPLDSPDPPQGSSLDG